MNGSTSSSPIAVGAERTDKDKKQPRESSTPKDNDKARDKDRETRLPACEACRTRKVKCDALLPACTPCQKSGRECFGRDKAPNVSRGLVYELQQKVKDLESKLALAATGNATLNKQVPGTQNEYGSDNASASGSRASRPETHSSKRQRRGRDGYQAARKPAQSVNTEDESSESDTASSSPSPPDPSPNDFIQQTSTILESLSSDLTGSAHRQHPPTLTRSTTQSLDNDEAAALAALTKHQRDRTQSPHRLKRRSSSNASRFREEAASYFTSTSRYRDVPPSAAAFKSRSRSGRFGTISAYDRTFYDRLIARYLTYMNTALPVINEIRLWEVAAVVYQDDERLRLSAMASSSYDTMPPPPLPPSPSIDRLTLSKHRYTVLMSLAIAIASLGRSHNFSPELRRLGHQYWSEAQALFPVLYRYGDIDKLRATLLQLQYAFLVPTVGSVWELSGAAIRLVTELNLHVDREYDSAANAAFSQEMIDLRRRLFWTTYCLDRSLAVALARPPGLSDAWIHVQLPSLLSDAELLRSDREASPAARDSNRVDPQKQIFRSHVNLRRIQSEILCRLHSVNPRDYSLDNDGISLSQPAPARPSLALVMEIGPPTPNLEWQSRMMTKLTEWKTEYGRIRLPSPAVDRSTTPSSSYSHQGESVSSSATPFVNGEWIDLTYNLTVSLLFRPSPNNPRPDSNGLQQAFTASGLAMKIYRSMHRSSTINFPWLATHHLFISGLTHLNALEKLTRIGSSCPSPIVEVVFNVQSCASTLEALTSRDDGYGTRIRDTFDAAASAVLRTVLEPGSSMVPSATTSFGPGTNTTADIASVEDFIRGSATTSVDSGPGRYTDRSRSSSLADTSNLRRSSHHDNFLQSAQHPTWLSDSTWSSFNTLDAAPPPGSTIFVAAPPRTTRFGTPGSSLVPTISERTTQSPQNTGRISNAVPPSPLSALQGPSTPTSRGFAMHSYGSSLTPTSMSFASSGINGAEPYQMNGNAAGGSQHNANNGTASAAGEEVTTLGPDRAASSTFGFHNWLLQPYEGGADGLNQFGALPGGVNAFNTPSSAAANAFLFGTPASPSAYTSTGASASSDPFQTMSSSHTNGAVTAAATAETDASTLLDFLSMLPPSAATATSTVGPSAAANRAAADNRQQPIASHPKA